MPPARQKGFEIREGGYYVGGKGKGYLIRHVTRIEGSGWGAQCYWESYHRTTGEANCDGMVCSANHLYNWAEREATPEEIARLGTAPVPNYRDEFVESLKVTVLRGVSDQELLAEAARRGLLRAVNAKRRTQ
jgi:hypothetical protein